MKKLGQALLNIITAPAVAVYEGLSIVIDGIMDKLFEIYHSEAVHRVLYSFIVSLGCGLVVFGIFSEFETIDFNTVIIKAAYIIVGAELVLFGVRRMPRQEEKTEHNEVLIDDVINNIHQQRAGNEDWNAAYQIAVDCNKNE